MAAKKKGGLGKGLGKGLDSLIPVNDMVSETSTEKVVEVVEVEKIVESALTKAKGNAKALAPSKELDLLTVTDSKGNEKVRQCAENVTRVLLNDPKWLST